MRRRALMSSLRLSIGFVLLAAFVLVAAPARAAVILTASEVGSDVLFEGDGTLDLTDLIFDFPSFSSSGVRSMFVVVQLGSTLNGPIDYYDGMSGPAHIGTSIDIFFPDSGAGDRFGVSSNTLIVPSGYISGAPLSASNTFLGHSFASLGLVPGTYVWTWGSGVHADSLTIRIGAVPVPEPSSILLIGTALAAGVAARKRAKGNRLTARS